VVLSRSSVEVGSAEDSSSVVVCAAVVRRLVVEGVGVSVADGVGDVELSPCEVVLSSSSSELVGDAVVED
jgi:hypothetical protein